jgi:hypothetical protein
LREALRREKASSLQRQNETVRILAEAFSRGPEVSLEELLESTEKNFELRSSGMK